MSSNSRFDAPRTNTAEEQEFENEVEIEDGEPSGDVNVDDLGLTDETKGKIEEFRKGEKKPEDKQKAPKSNVDYKGVTPPPANTDWSKTGPKLWVALHQFLAGSKTKHDDKYTVDVSHEHMADAHDAILKEDA